jgi:hypothetical protein
VGLAVRTLVNASDPEDIRKANALQDQLKIEAASAKPYTHPNYDQESYKATYDALIELGRGMPDTRATFGSKEDVDQVRHLIGTAWGWGGLPQEEAYYLNVEPNLPVGAYQLTFRDYAPPVVNDPSAAEHLRAIAASVLGDAAVTDGPMMMVAEDVAEFLDRTPGCFFVLGAMPETATPEPHHSPRFDIDERALPLGAAILAQAAHDWLRRHA